MAIDRKKLILDAATKSLEQFGYKATTMELVSKSANVGKGTIYTFYQTKEDLFREVMNSVISEMKAEADSVIDQEKSFMENVHAILLRMLRFRSTHQLTAKLLLEAREIGTQPVLVAIENIEKSILNFISNKVKKAVQSDEIRECDPEMTSFIIVKTYMAFIYDWEKNHDPLPEDEIAKLFELYLFKGLSIR